MAGLPWRQGTPQVSRPPSGSCIQLPYRLHRARLRIRKQDLKMMAAQDLLAYLRWMRTRTVPRTEARLHRSPVLAVARQVLQVVLGLMRKRGRIRKQRGGVCTPALVQRASMPQMTDPRLRMKQVMRMTATTCFHHCCQRACGTWRVG